MLTALLGLLTIAAPLGAVDARALAASARHPDAPGIRVWISSRDLFRRGERARVFYRTERDAFVTVLRVDTDGRVHLLFPRSPGDDNYAYAGTTYGINRTGHSEAFVVDDDPGVGYLFAVASDEPFDYHALLEGNQWDVRLASGGRVHGDPLAALEELVQATLPSGFIDFDTHLIPYYVERRYDYPRFVCYDCHAYTPYSYWDPYSAWCRRYTLVVWHDPFYYYPSYWYPTWYYGGTRVVYVNPGGSAPERGRYVFKTRDNSAPGIDYRDRRTTGAVGSRSGERFARGTDVGGVGSVAAPGRRTTDGGRRQDFVSTPGSEGLTPRSTSDTRRRAAERQDMRSPADDARRGTGIVPTTVGATSEPIKRREWTWRPGQEPQQPAPTERRSTGDESPRAEPQGGRRPEVTQPQQREPEHRAEPQREPERRAEPQRSPAAKPSAAPSARGGGGAQPSASGGSSAPSARPAASSGGNRPASPGLVRRRPS